VNENEKMNQDEMDFEERLRRFRGAEPPGWDLIAKRVHSRPKILWRSLAAAGALLVVAVMTTFYVVGHRNETKTSSGVAVHHVKAENAPEGADTNGPCLVVSSDNDVW